MQKKARKRMYSKTYDGRVGSIEENVLKKKKKCLNFVVFGDRRI